MTSSNKFNLEKIEDHKFDKNGKRWFWCKWWGYSALDNSWEPEEQLKLDGCKEFIKKYDNYEQFEADSEYVHIYVLCHPTQNTNFYI